ncbi:hypothetical protein ACIRF8_18885 [Streptomyces sp. NPDC102406]|uniref:hypothetical protein n=1 Tax=Streptomyces sp. NPDC102406 TaxID=3366171 RepID=UPI00380FE92E
MNSAADDNHTLVTVTLSNCSARDAESVLTYLTSEFPDRAPTKDGSDASGTPTTVWTAELDVSAGSSDAASGSASGEKLEGTVSVSAQGVPHEVDTVRKALGRAFQVEDAGSASGDQELDVQLRLTSR